MMPLQLLELATVIPRAFSQLFLTRTPRDHAELNAPSMANLGVVYPQVRVRLSPCHLSMLTALLYRQFSSGPSA